MTHTNTIQGNFLGDDLIKFWWKWLKAEVRTYKIWHDYWLNIARDTNIPIFFFRFEDVLNDKKHELSEIMRFILGLESIEGTVMERRV